ncbi:MAG: (Fe-S)-binding protein [Chloroflexota bacterium]
MEAEEALEQARTCTECGVCTKFCPTYRVSGRFPLSPIGRIQAAIRAFDGDEVGEGVVESLSSCLVCTECDAVCPYEIKVSQIVLRARRKLVERGLGPLEGQRKVIDGILSKGNAVNGAREARLEWLPEELPRRESDTLLYIGCLGSYVSKDAAASTYLVLKKLNFDFMLLEDEGCCGTYMYETGAVDFAGELFQRNADRFKSLGISKVVCLCPACLTCFKDFYPEVVGDTGFSVQHVAEVLHDLLRENQSVLKKVDRTFTYQDPCRLSRWHRIVDEPRQALGLCGVDLREMERRGEGAQCCGAGGGVMTAYRDLSTKVASDVLGMAQTDSIITSCPFCEFCLNRTAKATESEKRVTYFTSVLLDSLR